MTSNNELWYNTLKHQYYRDPSSVKKQMNPKFSDE